MNDMHTMSSFSISFHTKKKKKKKGILLVNEGEAVTKGKRKYVKTIQYCIWIVIKIIRRMEKRWEHISTVCERIISIINIKSKKKNCWSFLALVHMYRNHHGRESNIANDPLKWTQHTHKKSNRQKWRKPTTSIINKLMKTILVVWYKKVTLYDIFIFSM